MMTFVQMQAMTLEEIRDEIQKVQRELLEVQMGIWLNHEKNTAKKTHLRKHVARLQTAYTQKTSVSDKKPLSEKSSKDSDKTPLSPQTT